MNLIRDEAVRLFRSEKDRRVSLSPFESDLVLSVFPPGSNVEGAHFFDNYDLPCPVKVSVRHPDGARKCVVLRSARSNGSDALVVERMLSELGLPVPRVLSGPDAGAVVVSFLDGEDLQHFSMRSSSHAARAKRLLLDALETFDRLTAELQTHPCGRTLERRTLIQELERIPSGAWDSEPVYANAIERLRPVLEEVHTPLCFTNGDHQPANFLTDGEGIVGFLDFEDSCFRDPLMGLAKYPVYDLHPLNKAGFTELYLRERGLTPAEFAPRIALMCLTTLQRSIAIVPESNDEEAYRDHVLKLLDETMLLTAQWWEN